MNRAVIVVDDDDSDRYILARRIKESEIESSVFEFDAGDKFLDVFTNPKSYAALVGREPSSALVLLDINMPRISGFDVLERLAADAKTLNVLPDCFDVLMVTSSNREQDRNRALQYTFVKEFIVKPVDKLALTKAIGIHCG